VNTLKKMIDREGRCFILVNHYQLDDRDHSGHVMIIDEFHRQRGRRSAPRWKRRAYTRGKFAGRTLWRIRRLKVSGYEADYIAGARRFEERRVTPHWGAHADNDLVLVELRPGKDPDTREGLEDLNVIAGED
jgi:hypothetical protein